MVAAGEGASMSDDDPEVPIRCSECDTTTRVPLTDLQDRITQHNKRVHEGEEVAEVDPGVVEQLQNLVAEDLGLFDEDA
jgi:hypothetical protein